MPFIATDPRAGGSTIYEIPLPEPSQYRSTGKRTQNRGDLREHMDEKLRYLTDDPQAKMSWTLEEYLINVVGGCNQKVDGWKMRFVQPVTDDERRLYRADPMQFAPAPNCTHSKARRTRPDLGTRRKARRDPRGTLLYGPPKSAVEIEDSDIDDTDMFSSSPAQAPTQAAELSDDIESSDGFALEKSTGDELSDDIEDADGCLL